MEVGPPCAVDDLLVTRVLRDGAFHLGCRDGEDVAVCIKVAARLGTTLVAPVVVVVATNYDGIDPEVFNGFDDNLYPRPFSVILGLNLNF